VKLHTSATICLQITGVKMAQCNEMMSVQNKQQAVIAFVTAEIIKGTVTFLSK
jgi:hypothetical protein